MAELPNPHDAFIRSLLTDPERAHDFLRDHLPNNIAGQLVDEPPQILDGNFVDQALASSQSDILMKVNLKTGGEAFCYVLMEAKSTPEPGLPLQLATYMVRVWRRYAGDNHQKLRNLPPIIPLVIYTSQRAWNVPAGLAEMIAAPDKKLAFLPGERYILRNLRTMPLDKLSRNPALRAGFITLRKQALENLAAIAQALPENSILWCQILEYVVRTYDDVEIDGLKAALLQQGHKKLEALVGTIAETLLEQGTERGFAKGKAEGKAEGQADILLRMLEHRFGTLPPETVHLVRTASAESINTWADVVLDAPSLKAIFRSGQA